MAIKGSRVVVGDTPTPISSVPTDTLLGQTVLAKNPSTSTAQVFLGDGGVSTSTGYPLDPGEAIAMDMQSNETLYGVVAHATTIAVSVLESGV